MLIYDKWLLLDSRGVDVPMVYDPTFVMLSSWKPLFFNSLTNNAPFAPSIFSFLNFKLLIE